MRSSPLRLALSLAALLVATSLRCMAAADTEPAKAAPAAPAPVGPPALAPAPATTPAAGVAPAPAAAPTPAPAPAVVAPAPVPAAPVAAPAQDSAEAKLEIVLRSYTLLRDENDQLKAAMEKSAMEKSALEAQLNVMKDALPLAAQASGLHEQLRQTQDQLGALANENRELKTRLSLGSPAPGTVMSAPSHAVSPPAPPPAASVPAPAPAPRVHVVAAGETLGQISRQYYGTASRWPEILAANRDVVRNENSLTVGSKLRIP